MFLRSCEQFLSMSLEIEAKKLRDCHRLLLSVQTIIDEDTKVVNDRIVSVFSTASDNDDYNYSFVYPNIIKRKYLAYDYKEIDINLNSKVSRNLCPMQVESLLNLLVIRSIIEITFSLELIMF